MKLLHTSHGAFQSLFVNKSRTFLTILGIVIGITAIIIIVSVGQGAENLILGEIGGIGAETIAIRPGKEPSGPNDFADTLFADSLTKQDFELLSRKEYVPDAASIMPFVLVSGSLSYSGETYRPQILGGAAGMLEEMFSIVPVEGVMFDDGSVRDRRSVIVIGSKVKDELFGDEDAVGKLVRVKDRSFRVVGVLPQAGQKAFLNVDDLAIVPYTTAQTYLLGINHFHEIIVKARSTDVVDRTIYDIEATLRESHGISDPDKDDFFVVSQQSLVDQVQVIIGALTAFLSSVVAISLVVGGIGVMNIMLVSVTERTREIGLRKAVGATNKDILLQFLLESVFLTAIGGVIGVFLGTVFSLAASLILTQVLEVNWAFSFPIGGALLGIITAAGVGIIFGLYPARKASLKSPIEALRYE